MFQSLPIFEGIYEQITIKFIHCLFRKVCLFEIIVTWGYCRLLGYWIAGYFPFILKGVRLLQEKLLIDMEAARNIYIFTKIKITCLPINNLDAEAK